jgi:hypothetical protein
MPAEPSLFLREIDRAGLRIIGNAPYGFAAGVPGVSQAGRASAGGEKNSAEPPGMGMN